MGRSGVLLTGFGGPGSPDDVGPFMRNLMGREPSAELVERAARKYIAIGGASPLPKIASELAEALARRLPGEVPVAVGMRYWSPYIADVVESMAADGVTRLVTFSLSPFESKVASGAYREAVAEATGRFPRLEAVESPHLGDSMVFAEFLGHACRDALDDSETGGDARTLVLFTAHSLPVSDLVEDDPYAGGLRRLAAAAAGRAGLGAMRAVDDDPRFPRVSTIGSLEDSEAWLFCYQSKGARPGEWLGPLVDDIVEGAPEAGFDAIAVCPIGFLTDHMETLYDLDVELSARARELGLGYSRARVPNADPLVVDGIAELVGALL